MWIAFFMEVPRFGSQHEHASTKKTELMYFLIYPKQSDEHSSLVNLQRGKTTHVRTLIFLNTLLFSGSIMMLYTASGGNPALNLRLRLQREPSGTVTCK